MILSSDRQLSLSLHIEPCKQAKAMIVFSHGMAEHKERYYDFIHFLNQHDYLCAIYDHRGHGDSVKSKDDLGYFYDTHGHLIIEDLHLVINYMKTQYPNLDVYIFAHSMGTLVARNYLQKYDNEIKRIVLCGPPAYNPAASLGYYLAKLLAKCYGEKHRSQLLQDLAFKSFDKKVKASIINEWICSDIEQVKQYNQNDKCGYIFTTNGFQCLFYLMKHCFNEQAYQVNNQKLAMLFIAGEDDPVIANQKKFMKEITFMNELGYTNTRHILYPHLRHELLNEKGKEQIYEDVLHFFEQ
ncbi:MAG: alpha/beta fold hydrolase [Erysipelotrichia bacterium]|nr:alpha/beta fold hydrolase [Erysipelotrichia bacterium]NCC54290.1 alpha/beta fold hydrolase [Erysipelotrichia bacterium]